MKSLIISIFFLYVFTPAQAGIKVEAKLDIQILFLINQERQAHGLSTLTLVEIPEAKQNCDRLLCEDRVIKAECSAVATAEYKNVKSVSTDVKETKKNISTKWSTIRDQRIGSQMHASYEANALAVADAIPNGQLYEIVDYSAEQSSSAITVFQDFKNSPAHYKIILEPTANYIAIGTAIDSHGGIFCTVFIISVK